MNKENIDSAGRTHSGAINFARPLFAFDLDGTVTRVEILPRLAAALGLEREIDLLTRQTLRGEIPFELSFRRRFALLNRLPLTHIREVVARVPLDEEIARFIRSRPADCLIVTGNLDCWIAPLVTGLGCRVLCSTSGPGRPKPRRTNPAGPAPVLGNSAFSRAAFTGPGGSAEREIELVRILDKGEAISGLKAEGRPIVAVGESVGDIPMFREAALGLAYAGVHRPVPGLLALASGVFFDGASLCAFLESLAGGAVPGVVGAGGLAACAQS